MADQQTPGAPPALYRGRKILLTGVFLAFLALGGFAVWMMLYSRTPGPPGPPEVVVSIPRGTSVTGISQILGEAGVIDYDIRFSYLARIKGVAGKLRAGEFVLRTGRAPLAVLDDLATALPLQHPVTIVEGLNAAQIASVYARGGWCDIREFMEKVEDSSFISSLGFQDLTSLEGYLYPDTYHLTRIPPVSTEQLIRRMVSRFREVWKEIGGDDEQLHRTVILASIVEKETGAAFERARIASVFHNRLALGMRLQSDPTVIYGITDFSGNLTREHLRTSTPYNTYTISGLPPGPICNPGKESLAAVLRPSNEDYLYFVSRNDGTHYFSKNLQEHNRAVQKYQKEKTHR